MGFGIPEKNQMHKYKLAGGAVALAIAFSSAPAFANDGYVEARGGIISALGDEEATAGVAAGYDFDLNDTLFAGVEVSGDKVLVDGSDIYVGFTGRIGTRLGENTKLFAAGGYTVGEGEDVPHLGAGLQQNVSDKIYVKAEYRHFFGDFADADSGVVGVGVRF